ncbi:TPA: hypothetical protein HA281_02975 [Candidatus Woesearchaeota archaeon]|nr:hypothetical protein [Candidatus Woesearchaeota archaeon]HII64853.1 hypothetical protein [Candidatus Woesearchaeota archaeon]
MLKYTLPGKAGLLPSVITIPHSSIEIVRPFDGSRVTDVLFDFDGAISLERDGWLDIIEKKRERLINAGAHILVPDFRDAGKLVEVVMSRYGK